MVPFSTIKWFPFRLTKTTAGIVLLALLLSCFSTSEYVQARGLPYLESGYQLQRHLNVLEGRAGDPWQYRVLASYLVEGALRISAALHVPHHVAAAFILFRIAQDAVIMLLPYAYYRKLGLPLAYGLVGMALLAWGISYSHYDSDLQFNTFFDIIFYLLAGLCILADRPIWIVPITLLAALNRETSGLIPLLPILVSAFAGPKGSLRRAMPVSIIAFVTYLVVFVGLRLAYGKQALIITAGGRPGVELLRYNLFRLVTWQQLLATLSIIPIVAILGYRKWAPGLRVLFWGIVPIWFVAHALGAVMAETRLSLVPQALVFIPGTLFALSERMPPGASPPHQWNNQCEPRRSALRRRETILTECPVTSRITLGR